MQESCRDLKKKSNQQTIRLYRPASSSWRDRYVLMWGCEVGRDFEGWGTVVNSPCFKVNRVIIQVKTLQLERDQSQMMLESIQQRHKQDVDLLENTHRWFVFFRTI